MGIGKPPRPHLRHAALPARSACGVPILTIMTICEVPAGLTAGVTRVVPRMGIPCDAVMRFLLKPGRLMR